MELKQHPLLAEMIADFTAHAGRPPSQVEYFILGTMAYRMLKSIE